MPPNASRVSAAVEARISRSDFTLTIWFPELRATPAGTAPIAMPASPLMKAPNPTKPPEEEPTRVQDAISMPCLFLETSMMSDARRERLAATLPGWSHEARAMVRVRSEDIERPQGGVWFEGSAYVDVNGRKYKVLGWSQMGNSFTQAASYTAILGAGA
jgi:hypothetical protein